MKATRTVVVAAVLGTALVTGGLSLRGAGGLALPGIALPTPEILPRSAVLHLSLRDDEVPPAYGLLHDGAFLESMGMKENPDYVGNLSQAEALATRGALTSFLAVYGSSAQPRLMLNGVFFRDAKHFDKFVRFQEKKKRPVVMLRKTQPDGLWLFIAARDQAVAYTAAEQGEIVAGLRRYQQRISADLLSETMWAASGTTPDIRP